MNTPQSTPDNDALDFIESSRQTNIYATHVKLRNKLENLLPVYGAVSKKAHSPPCLPRLKKILVPISN